MFKQSFKLLLCVGFSLFFVCLGQVQLLATVQSKTIKSKPMKSVQHEVNSFRLPYWTQPEHYDLFFSPDLNKSTFIGSETLSLKLEKESKYIVLNSKDLIVHKASISNKNNLNKSLPAKVFINSELEQVTFNFSQSLAPGNYQLEIKFSGILNDKLVGFYRSSFTDSSGKKHFIATTQMEPTDARRMFPCFDEPSFKASYKISTAINPIYTAISNAPIQEDSIDKSGKRIVSFATTEKMSSYLLALLIGEFKAGKTITINNIHNAYATY